MRLFAEAPPLSAILRGAPGVTASRSLCSPAFRSGLKGPEKAGRQQSAAVDVLEAPSDSLHSQENIAAKTEKKQSCNSKRNSFARPETRPASRICLSHLEVVRSAPKLGA